MSISIYISCSFLFLQFAFLLSIYLFYFYIDVSLWSWYCAHFYTSISLSPSISLSISLSLYRFQCLFLPYSSLDPFGGSMIATVRWEGRALPSWAPALLLPYGMLHRVSFPFLSLYSLFISFIRSFALSRWLYARHFVRVFLFISCMLLLLALRTPCTPAFTSALILLPLSPCALSPAV